MDLYDLLGDPDDASAQEKAQAYAQALRRKQGLATLAGVSGNKMLAPMAGPMAQSAEQGQEALGQARQFRLRQAVEKQRAEAQAQQQAIENEYRRRSDSREGARLSLAQEAARRERDQTRFMQDRLTGEWVDVRTGTPRQRPQPIAPVPSHVQNPAAVAASRPAQAPESGTQELIWRKKLPPQVGNQLFAAEGILNDFPRIKAEVDARKDAFGMGAEIGEYLPVGGKLASDYQKASRAPDDTRARAAVFERAYSKIKELAGTAMSANEQSRIEQFLPGPNDTYDNIVVKLEQAYQTASEIQQRVRRDFSYAAMVPDDGFDPYESLGAMQQQATTSAAPGDRYLD